MRKRHASQYANFGSLLSCFCYGYTEQSGFFGADLCGSGLFLSAIRVDGLQKVSPLKSNRSLENDSKTIFNDRFNLVKSGLVLFIYWKSSAENDASNLD